MPTATTLRTRWPNVFGSTTLYPDSALNAAISAAGVYVPALARWCSNAAAYEEALTLYSAHLAAHGGASSAMTAVGVASASSGGESVSFRDAAQAAATAFEAQYSQLTKRFRLCLAGAGMWMTGDPSADPVV